MLGHSHMWLLDSMSFSLAKDKWYPAFNGQMSDFNFVQGPGAYLSGLPNYLPIMYRDNPRSVKVESVGRTNLVLSEL